MGIIYLFLAKGFEEIEALATVDILRRADLQVKTVSISNQLLVIGVHGIAIQADTLFDDESFSDASMLILPGGMPGASNLEAHSGLRTLLLEFARDSKPISAICAAPYVLGKLNILNGVKATCYPGFEDNLLGAKKSSKSVVADGNIITGNGPGAACKFAYKIVEHFCGKNVVEDLKKKMMVVED